MSRLRCREVSRISGGRLVVGLGIGSDESGDFSGFGEPADATTRSAMLAQGLEVMRAMWAGRAVRRGGPHYSVSEDLAAAGMTWWLESLIHFDPLELSMAVVDAGPHM